MCMGVCVRACVCVRVARPLTALVLFPFVLLHALIVIFFRLTP